MLRGGGVSRGAGILAAAPAGSPPLRALHAPPGHALLAPPACGGRTAASARPTRAPAADARPRARVRPSERPREPRQSERRGRARRTEKEAAAAAASNRSGRREQTRSAVGRFFFYFKNIIKLENLAFLNGAGPRSAGGFLCFKMGFAVSVVGTSGGLIVSLLRAFLRPGAEHCM